MLQLDGDSLASVSDDALFGSGPAHWNAQPTGQQVTSNNDTENQVIYNQLRDLHMDGVPGNDDIAEMSERPRTNDRSRGGATNTSGARPKVNNTERTGHPASGEVREGTRNKTIKDKENKNKNSNMHKANTQHQNGWFSSARNNTTTNTTESWEPRLQLVNYDNPPQRIGNSVKQRKQALNQNAVRTTPEDLACANDTEADTEEYLRLPNGLDPNVDPSSISHIYSRPHYRRNHVLPPSTLDSDRETNNVMPTPVEDAIAEGNPEKSVNRIHNDLWVGSKNCNVRESARAVQTGTSSAHAVQTGTGRLKLESLRNETDLMLARADLPVPGGNSPNLRSEQIVQHFPVTNIPQVSHNKLNGQNGIQNLALTGDSQITVPYDRPATAELSRSDLPVTLDSLQSNLPTDFMFGDGKNSDYYMAQQLQLQFDQENADFQQQRQYDSFSNYDYSFMSPDQRSGLTTTSSTNRPVGSSSSSRAVDPYTERVLNDLYDQSGGLGDGLSDSLFITTQNGEPSDIGTISPDIQYDLPSQMNPDPSLSPSNSHCLRNIGGCLEDENLARIMSEEMRLEEDERLARQLQEEDAIHERAFQVPQEIRNYGNRGMDVNEYRENSEPLYARYNRTWHRPLTVPTNGRSNVNVYDSPYRGQSSTERPLGRRSEFEFVENFHHLPNRGGYDLIPGDYGEDSLVSINRDPRMLATLLMERAPDMMIPNEIDLNDYEALWELAEGLGEVRRVGMEQTAIVSLPIHVYQGPNGAEDNKTDCLVCLSEFQKGEELRTLPCCHFYHVDCIDQWLKRNAICPVCRQPANQRQ